LQEVPPYFQMLRLMVAPWLSACIHIAAKRSFADIIEAAESHQASIEHISREANVHPIWTRAILQALARAHIFVETEQDLFKNTPHSDYLRHDHPQTLKWQASVILGSRPLVLLSQLDYYINQVGTSIVQELWGQELYELLEKQDEDQSTRLSPERVIIELESRAEFDMMLEGIGLVADTAIAEAYQFKGSVCDLGGGRGSLLTTIARHHPDVQGILFERQFAIDNLQSKHAEYPFSLVVGDFFQQVPHADIYILKQIFHNWPDNLCSAILQKCAEANPDAKVLVIERVIGDLDNLAEIGSIIMMIEQNGKERAIDEYRSIGKNAGFNYLQVHPTKSGSTIVELAIGTL
jgi:O-methyltransferase